MKILLLSNCFYPSIGGSETNAEILAREFTKLGHQVIVVTETFGNNIDVEGFPFPFKVFRNPNWFQLIKLINWCDVYFHNGISLRKAWPLLLIRKPWVIRHQVWLRNTDGQQTRFGGSSDGIKVRLKHWLNRYAVSISNSQAIADHLKSSSTVIPNPYRDHLFKITDNFDRNKEIIFLGRLVSEKGVNLLLESLAELSKHGLNPNVTIIGNGPERQNLELQTQSLNIAKHISFIGSKTGKELVNILNQHHIMVIPSLYDEPFGVVALEGIACGCVVVGSEGGGLKDAIGSCGITFPNGNVQALTQVLLNLLQNPAQLSIYRANASEHLLRHQKLAISKAYLEVIERAVNFGQ